MTRAAALAALFLITAAPLAGQDAPAANVAKGFGVDKSYQVNDVDAISTFNGNLTVTLPIGRRYAVSSALSYQFALTYGGNVWKFTTRDGLRKVDHQNFEVIFPEHALPGIHSAEKVLRNTNAGLGWNLTLGYFEVGSDAFNEKDGYVSPDGARHVFHPTLAPGPDTDAGVSYTRDGSHLRLTTEDGFTQVAFGDGTRHRFDPLTGRIRSMLDRFGNVVAITYTRGAACSSDPSDCAEDWEISDGSRTHKVDMKRVYASGLGSLAFDVVKSVTFSDASTYSFAYVGGDAALTKVSRQLATNQDCRYAPQILAAVLESLTLPDLTKYAFDTDRGKDVLNAQTGLPEPAFASHDGSGAGIPGQQDCTTTVTVSASVSGHLRSIKRPTGATTTWTYQMYVFPAYVGLEHDECVATYGCGWVISTREALGVLERSEKDRAGNTLSRKTYTYERGDGWRKTIVTSFEGTVAAAKSVHYYSTHFARSDERRPEYGLPYMDAASSTDIPPNETNPDSGGRFLSSKVLAGDDKLLSYRYVAYAGERGAVQDETIDRRVVSERSVSLAADGAVVNDVRTTYSDYDGYGHHRTARTTTGPGSTPAIDRTVTTRYNRPDAATSTVNTYDSGTFPGSFVSLPPGDPWIVNTYSSETASENTINADGLLQRQSMKSLSLFDRSDGLLKRRRTLKTIASEVRPAGAAITDPPFTTAPEVPLGAHDLVVELGHTGGNMTSEAYYGGDEQSVGLGSLVSLALSSPEYSMTHTYSAGALATTQYSGIPFKSVDRTINAATGLASSSRDPSGVETKYEYDWAGRLTFSAPGGSAAMTYAFLTPATGASTATIKQRNGSEKTSSVITTAIVEYDDLGRVSREKRQIPTGAFSIRDTVYNRLGQVASVSEWASEAVPAELDRKTELTYDALGRVVVAKAPDQTETRTSYRGQRTVARTVKIATSATAETDAVTTETNDDLGRLIEVKEPGGAVTAYTYAVGGKLASVTVNDGLRQDPRTFEYDGRGVLTSETHPESGTSTYTYDSRGHVTARSGGSTISFTYDAAERLLQVDEGSSPLKVFTFDRPNIGVGTVEEDRSMGKLATAKRHNRGTPSGDLIVLETHYYTNSAGRLSKKETALSTGQMFTESYTYTRLGAPVSVKYPACAGCGTLAAPDRTIGYSYDFGFLSGITNYGTIGYAPSGLVTSVTHQKIGGGQTTDTYEPDPTGVPRPSKIAFAGFCNDLSVNGISDKTATTDTDFTVTATATGATAYQLFKVTTDGATAIGTAGTSSSMTVRITGTAQYFVRVGNGTCTVDSNTFTIAANSCAAPPSTITVSSSTVPRNGSATASVVATTGAAYAWSIQGGTITSPTPRGASITFRPDCDAANVTLSVTVTASCGTPSPLGQTSVPTGPATTASISVSGSSTINQGSSKTISVALTGTGPWTVNWAPSAPSCNATSASFTCTATPPGTTTYVLAATDANGCSAESEPLTITVIPPAPFGLLATATSATAVQLAWGFSGSADRYEIQRRAAGGSFVADGTAATTGTLRTATANAAYLYRVRAVMSDVPSAWSNVDLATTVIFADEPVTSGASIRALHVMELRTAINAVRALWNNTLGPFAFTDSSLAGSGTKGVHVQELRDVLSEARTGLVLGGVPFTDPLLAGLMMKAVHITELRGGVR